VDSHRQDSRRKDGRSSAVLFQIHREEKVSA
jgi:hypothetical protein